MGRLVEESEISIKIDELINELNWYKNYMNSVEDLPFEQDEFITRNKEILCKVKVLEEELLTLKKCSNTNNFKFSEIEMKTRFIYCIMLLRYFRLA